MEIYEMEENWIMIVTDLCIFKGGITLVNDIQCLNFWKKNFKKKKKKKKWYNQPFFQDVSCTSKQTFIFFCLKGTNLNVI
jgi:hypothetical protein